ncbi:feline leukemia virus subgroup C receptor-related protein 1-like [Drosophila miranda]|uniref:feline leukemia virus subgroup C receptor-related protein 1-like n=1 Tax=Drosophila miranda TaxID=7229 RepID=UPI00143FAE07|nr:feline leukemia virus subgroup C receptor-related protein 1-like [Drosophila miranda]
MDLKHSGTGAAENTDSYIAASKSTDMISPKEKESKAVKVGGGVGVSTGNAPPEGYKVYARRWAVLILFVLYSASNAMQWIQYTIINNIITRYYGISDKWVDWTSMIYMILYIPLIFPGSWFLDKVVSGKQTPRRGHSL